MGTAAERLVEALIAPAKQFESLSLGLDLVHGLDLRRIFILPCMETIRSLTLCVGSYRVTDETMGIIAGECSSALTRGDPLLTAEQMP